MTDEQNNQRTNNTNSGDITRRDFATFLVGAGLAATVPSAAATDPELVESDVEIKTPDGTCDAAFIHRSLRPRPIQGC